MSLFDLNDDPGVGELNARAYVASVVGPSRVAHGQRKTERLIQGRGVEIAKNAARHNEVFYVEVWLPRQFLGSGALILFSSSSMVGESGDLVGFTAVGRKVDNRYRAILLPNEQLYAQLVSDISGNDVENLTVIVSKVTF